MSFRDIRWGELYYCDLGENAGSVQSGIRPVMVISSNYLNGTSTVVTVAVITSRQKTELKSHVKIGTECGLKNDSVLMLEQIRTIDVGSQLMEQIGKVTDDDKKQEIRNAIKFATGIPFPSRTRKIGTIMSLCSKCREKIYNGKIYNIKRLDPLQSEMKCCDRCNNAFGYDYLLTKKNDLSNVQI